MSTAKIAGGASGLSSVAKPTQPQNASTLGRLLTSFTNGLLGENYPAGNIPAAQNVGDSFRNAFNSIPGVSDTAERLQKIGGAAGIVSANTGTDPLGLNPEVLAGSQTNPFTPGSTVPGVSGSGVTVPSDGGTAVAMPDYLYADIAKAYGMDAATAYQEALSNTSYRRAMADLQAAGLNPILAAQGMTGSGGVYGAQVSGSGVSTGVSTAKAAHGWYKSLSNIGAIISPILGGSSREGKLIFGAIGNLIDQISE